MKSEASLIIKRGKFLKSKDRICKQNYLNNLRDRPSVKACPFFAYNNQDIKLAFAV